MGTKGIIIPSTREFIKEAQKSNNYSLFNLLHGYIYGRWTHFYIAVATGRHALSKRLAPLVGWLGKMVENQASRVDAGGNLSGSIRMEDTYHGKVVQLEAARQLVTVKEDIALGDLEKVIPYNLARDIILKNPDHIAVLDCPCRAAVEHPCLPLDVCLVVGEPFASFVVDHAPKKARMISQGEAEEILKAEDERGHVHHAFFKDAMLGRFYAICNCCSCCCGAMLAQSKGSPMLASSGYAAEVDEGRCAACGICAEMCQFGAIAVNGKAEVNLEQCMGCGICANNCPSQAIHMVRMQSKGEPLEIKNLIEAFKMENSGQGSS
jgi:ferredoxin